MPDILGIIKGEQKRFSTVFDTLEKLKFKYKKIAAELG